MSEQKMKSAWALLCFRVKPHSEQTRSFTWPLSDSRVPGQLVIRGFTQKELVRMSPVTQQTISAMRYFLPLLPPKNQPEFRRQLAYLTELRDLQSEAWADAIGRAEAEAEANRRKLQELQNSIPAWA